MRQALSKINSMMCMLWHRTKAKWLMFKLWYNPDMQVTFRNLHLKGYNFGHSILANAVFEQCDLSGASFRHAKLGGNTSFSRCYMGHADFSDSVMYNVKFRSTNMHHSNFTDALLNHCTLVNCGLSHADARGTRFNECELEATALTGTNFAYAHIRDTKIDFKCTNPATTGILLTCPEEGSFIAFKKAVDCFGCDVIVKLLVPEDALRSSSTTRKCRVSKAKVLSITTPGGLPSDENAARSMHDVNFWYRIGETVEVEDFNTDRWAECAAGIHCFITRQEAVNY